MYINIYINILNHTCLDILYQIYFDVNKMQNMLTDDSQYPSHLPELRVVLFQ